MAKATALFGVAFRKRSTATPGPIGGFGVFSHPHADADILAYNYVWATDGLRGMDLNSDLLKCLSDESPVAYEDLKAALDEAGIEIYDKHVRLYVVVEGK